MVIFKLWFSSLHNLKFRSDFRFFRKYSDFKTKSYIKASVVNSEDPLDKLITKYASRLIYNSIIERKVLKYDRLVRYTKSKTFDSDTSEPLPISLKYLYKEVLVSPDNLLSDPDSEEIDEKIVTFPYSISQNVEQLPDNTTQQSNTISQDVASEAAEEVRKRHELQKEVKNWMLSYDNYDDSCLIDDLDDNDWKVNYGTPDPKYKVSNTPCGGCGALLHCKDTAIPGYIPSEIFKHSGECGSANLEAIVCQRCHFLKYYNIALQMQVCPNDYPKVLANISQKQGLVVLMVDLLDFPCSIWPGIADIFGHKMPIVVVGNKVDLLPQDSENFLRHIKTVLINNVKLQGFATFNIKEVSLISAKTGFGVEDLITKLNELNRLKGDVYIVGSTNVGKSSLFNALLQSDYCKVQAVDLIQRATTSVWPGTTLNLLKFPIKRPAGYRQYLRHKRLINLYEQQKKEKRLRKEQLRRTKDPQYATLIGHFGITANPHREVDEANDNFSVRGHSNASGKLKMGVDEKSPEFMYSKWCFDTPGVVQSDQIIHLLTTEELLVTLPKQLILPRSFCLKPQSSLFIAGLARLDYIDGPSSVRLTVFASNELPLTVCSAEDAGQIYQDLLGSDLFKIPTGNLDRISKWPDLELAKSFTVTGEEWYQSSNDVVLSSAGWIAISGRRGLKYNFHAWTPEKRGVHVRDCLLPHTVGLAGKRIKHNVAYNKHRFFLK